MGVDAGDLDLPRSDAAAQTAPTAAAPTATAPNAAAPTAAAPTAAAPTAAAPTGTAAIHDAAERVDPLEAAVGRFTTSLLRWGPHRPPTAMEAAAVPDLVEALSHPRADTLATAGEPLGLSLLPLDDRHLLLASAPDDERSWLLVVVEPDVVPTVVVEVPHPHADLHTEVVGLAVARAVPGALYLQAGAHRVAGASAGALRREDCPADVSARPDAVFSLVADGLVARLGVPQVQVHGFADHADRDFDVVVSPGAASPGPLVAAVVTALGATGERVRTPDAPGCVDLAGRRNVQGRSAARHGGAFVHLELSRSLRRDRRRGGAVARAISDVLLGAGPGGRRGDEAPRGRI